MKIYRHSYRWISILLFTLWCSGVSHGQQTAASQNSEAATADKPVLSVQLGHPLMVMAVAYSPDLKLALTGGDGGAVLWDVASKAEIRRFSAGDGGIVTSVAFSPDNRFVLTASYDRVARLWNIETGEEIRRFVGHTSAIRTAQFFPGQDLIASLGSVKDDPTLRVWQVTTGKEVRRLDGKKTMMTFFAISPDGLLIATANSDGTVRLFDSATLKELHVFKGHSEGVNSVAFTPDGRFALSVDGGGAARLWDIANRTERPSKIKVTDNESIAFSPDGRTFLTAGDSNVPRLWSVETGNEVRSFNGHTMLVSSVAFSSDGRQVLTGSFDRTARLWDAQTGMELGRLEGRASSILAAALSPDGRYIATGSESLTSQLWDLSTGEVIKRFGTASGSVQAVAFSPDGRLIANARKEAVLLWDRDKGFQRLLEGHRSTVRSVAFSPDGKYLVTGSGDGSMDSTIRLWDVTTGKEIRRIGSHQLQVNSVVFSRDGRLILSGGFDGQACLWDTATGQLDKCVRRPGYVYSVAFSPDGKRFVTGHTQEMYFLRVLERGLGIEGVIDYSTAQKHTRENVARLWDVGTGKELREFDGHSSLVHSVNFSPDGRFVLIGTGNFLGYGSNAARTFEADTGREIKQFNGHAGFVMSAAFSPNGRFVMTASTDSTVRLWEPETGKEICRLIYLSNYISVVVDPQRNFFDTKQLEAINGVHWVMPEDPMRPLPMEIFMRDYYEPRLLPRLMANDKFKPVRPLSTLNRVQPNVRITKIEPQPNAADAVAVTVEVSRAEGKFRRGSSEMTRETGVYDLRLFRDQQMVGYEPKAGAELLIAETAGKDINEELESWRGATEVKLDAGGKATKTFVVKLAHKKGVKQIGFSAYAFNVDRVKSVTDRKAHTIDTQTQTTAEVKGRAYLITVGVNDYQNPQVRKLLYPANDARSIRDTLSEALQPNYEVVAVPLIADIIRRSSETVIQPTKDNFKAVLELLSGREVAADRLKNLPAEIQNKIRRAGPDDLVLISFATHGEADDRGIFYLYPYDTGPARPADGLLTNRISSEELSLWLRDVDAGELVMILDACHSGAAPGADFKPGPMGSRGLGQLAYDKGMRILAATQADNVALGSGESRSGLLTTALIRDAIEKKGAARDGKIMMRDWLEYGAQRVPSLYTDEIPKDDQQKVQQPALFDFSGKNSVLLVLGK